MMSRDARSYWLRRGPWFFSWNLDSEETQLFNLVTDPRSNRSVAPENRELVAEFQHSVDSWRASYEK